MGVNRLPVRQAQLNPSRTIPNGLDREDPIGFSIFEPASWRGHRTVSIHKADRMGLYQAKKGDEVILVFDENNLLIDLHKKGVPPAGHHLIAGELTYADLMWKVVEISNAEGTYTFAMDEDASSQLSHLKERELVWAELNEDNMVIDIHHLR